jgi:hypothetical protein
VRPKEIHFPIRDLVVESHFEAGRGGGGSREDSEGREEWNWRVVRRDRGEERRQIFMVVVGGRFEEED